MKIRLADDVSSYKRIDGNGKRWERPYQGGVEAKIYRARTVMVHDPHAGRSGFWLYLRRVRAGEGRVATMA